MFGTDRTGNSGIVGRNRRAGAQRGLHQAGSSGAGPTCAATCAARASARCASSITANAPAGSSLHYASINAAKNSSCLGAQDIGIGNGKVIARDGQVEVILQRQANCVFERDVEFAVANQLGQQSGIRELWF